MGAQGLRSRADMSRAARAGSALARREAAACGLVFSCLAGHARASLGSCAAERHALRPDSPLDKVRLLVPPALADEA